MSVLEAKKLGIDFGGLTAVNNFDIKIEGNDIYGLIGPNGAGKTTTMHALSGLIKAKSGSIVLDGKDITKVPANKIVGLGLIQVPEGRHVFASQTVLENLTLGAYLCKDKKLIEANLNHVFELFPRLKERQKQLAGTLSGGEQQMLAMGRALMSNPKVLLLDEPSMGLSPLLVKEIFAIIKEINDNGTTVFVVEQNAKMALEIAHRAYVMETGKIVLSGTGKDLLASDAVSKAYLGG